MRASFVEHLCKSVQAPKALGRCRDLGIGLLIISLNQLAIVPIQLGLERRNVGLPASVLVMVFVFLFMVVANRIHGGVARFYNAHLQGPVDFLGRHISLGFVAPFVMLSRDHISNPLDAPRIAGAFGTYSPRKSVAVNAH